MTTSARQTKAGLLITNGLLEEQIAALRELLTAIGAHAVLPLPIEEDWQAFRRESGIRLHDIAMATEPVDTPAGLRARADGLRHITRRGFSYRSDPDGARKPPVAAVDEHEAAAPVDEAAANV